MFMCPHELGCLLKVKNPAFINPNFKYYKYSIVFITTLDKAAQTLDAIFIVSGLYSHFVQDPLLVCSNICAVKGSLPSHEKLI